METQEEYGEYGAMFGLPVFTCFRACWFCQNTHQTTKLANQTSLVLVKMKIELIKTEPWRNDIEGFRIFTGT